MEPNPQVVNTAVDTVQSTLPDVGLIILAIFTIMALVFSLLVLRQVNQMMRVLPNPLSPHIRTVAYGYVLYVVLTLVAIIWYLLP